MMSVVLLLLGFVILYFGAEWLVRGASEIASHLHLSKSFIGLTLVAFGTSAPELFVNVIAGFAGNTPFALANVAGSNLTNLCIGFGCASFACTIPIARRDFLVDLVFFVAAPAVVLAFLAATGDYALPVWSLLPLGVLLVIYLVSLGRRRVAAEAVDPSHLTLRIPVLLFVAGSAALYTGGHLVFHRAIELAQQFNIAETTVGLTIVACGTSIPDVMASVIAARRREFGISVGNLVGSNISNIFVVLGGTIVAVFSSGQGPLSGDRGLAFDYAAVTALSLLFLLVVARTQRVTARMGIVLVAAFALYYTVRLGVAAS